MSQWRVAIGQKQYGPYTLEKLREIFQDGRVPEDAQIWHPQKQEWVSIELVTELKSNREDVIIMDDQPAPVGGLSSQSSSDPLSASNDSVDTIGDYLAFRQMITPIMIQIIFWIGAVLSSMAGIFMMISSIRIDNPGGIFIGFFTMLLGPIGVRIFCELLIVFFRMNETLSEIRNDQKKRS